VLTKGYCTSHYQQFRKSKELEPLGAYQERERRRVAERRALREGRRRARQALHRVRKSTPDLARQRAREQYRRKRARRLELVEAEIVRRGDACEDCGKPYDGNRRAFYWRRRDSSAEQLDVGTLTGIGTVERLLRALSESDFVCASCHRRRESNAWSVHYTA
jgi:hypothetical protein